MKAVRGVLIAAGLLAAMPVHAQGAATITLPANTAPEGMVEQPCPEGSARLQPQADWAWLCRYQAQNRLLGSRPRVVFIGDSITEFWLPKSPALFAGGTIDRGISGQTSPQILLRFYQDVIALRPRVVHIMIGTNDLAGNTGLNSPEEFTNNIKAMTDLAQANGIAVAIGSIPPAMRFPWKPALTPAAQIVVLNRWLAEFAKARGAVFADYHAVLADEQGAMKPGFSGDGVHPTAAGYAAMEPVARKAIAEALRLPGKQRR